MVVNSLCDSLVKAQMQSGKLLVYSEMPLGSVVKDRGTQRADVLTMTKSYKPLVRIYEVKRTRADFLSDVRRGKYLGYMSHCHQLFWAVPRGLITKAEIPDDTGLTVWNEMTGWHVVKAPRRHDMDVSHEMLLALLFRGALQIDEGRVLRERMRLEENVRLSDMAVNLDLKIKRRLASIEPDLEQIKSAHDLIDKFLGRKSRDLQAAVWELQHRLSVTLPGLENIEVATNLLTVANLLMRSPGNSLSSHGAFKQLEKFVEESANGRG